MKIDDLLFETKTSNKNLELLKYLSGDDFDVGHYWSVFADWAVHYDDGSGEIISILSDITDQELWSEEFDDEIRNVLALDSSVYYKIPRDKRNEFEAFAREEIDALQDTENTRKVFRLNKEELLPQDTVLIHYTDYPEEILRNGFRHGMPYITHLGETVRLSGIHKNNGGYNFAYRYIGDIETDQALRVIQNGWSKRSGYVLFKSSGVDVYHYGDHENQVIFWGPYVRPSDFIDGGAL